MSGAAHNPGADLLVPADTPLHRAAPQCKVAATALCILLVACTPRDTYWPYIGYALVLATAAYVAQIPATTLLRRLVVEIPFVFFVILLPFLATGDKIHFLGVPLAVPIAILVFLGSFIPIVGAVVTGALAVFVALVYHGIVIALIMLGVVLLVQQVEGHVLQPLIMGTAVKVHPLAVVLVVTAGSLLAGITGALFAVPFAAVLNAMIGFLSADTGSRGSPSLAQRGTALWQSVPAERVRRNRALPGK